MRSLHFISGGNSLLLADEKEVVVWDILSEQRRFLCPEMLIGISREGDTFLTWSPDTEFSAWDASNGQRISLESIRPDAYPRSHRTLVRGGPVVLQLELRDALNINEPHSIRIRPAGFYPSIDTWALSPNDRSLMVAISFESMGHEWAAARCVDLNGGYTLYEIEVDRFQSQPQFNFSAEHGLMVVRGINRLILYQLDTGEQLRHVWIDGAYSASLNPLNPWLVAVDTYVKSGDRSHPFNREVQLLNFAEVRAEGVVIQRAKVEQHLPESAEIVRLAFHPDGNRLACLTFGGEIHLWDLHLGEIVHSYRK